MKKILIVAMIFLNTLLLRAVPRFSNDSKKSETIYAVMITGKDSYHKHLAERSIQSFLEQTYPNKHLFIINDGEYSLGYLKSNLITEVKLNKKCVLGRLRNIGINEIPQNGIYLQWDDDDWHHPDLMEKQYRYMKNQRADGCFLESQIIYCFNTNAAWISSRKSGIEGTIMCRRRRDVFYPERAKSEDSIFFREYAKKYRLVRWNNPSHYYLRFVHGHNTWDENHFGIKKYKKDLWAISQTAIDYLARIIPFYIDTSLTSTQSQK